MKYVIVGNSTAAAAAIEAIRGMDKEGTITVVSEEPYKTYSRPLITHWLAGKVDSNGMHYKGTSFYEKNGVTAILGKRAVKLDTKKRALTLAGGKRITYDRLLLATGGKPIIPPIKGGNLNGVFTFANWDDAKKVKAYIQKNRVKKVVVVGGGLIGLKSTEALAELGLSVTVVELADRILSATFDKKASELVMGYLKDKGITIKTETTVEEVTGRTGKVSGVTLKEGKKIPCEMVILAVGVRPNTELANDTKIKVERGILVDSRMETNVPGVFAAGDVVLAKDALADAMRTIAVWPLAVRQGRVAGVNMAGGKAEYAGGFPLNSVEIHGLPTISVGVTDPKEAGYSVVKEHKPSENVYRKIVLKDGKIKGAIFVGRIERAGIFTGLIESGLDVGKLKSLLLGDSFGLILLPKDYRKHLVTGLGIEV